MKKLCFILLILPSTIFLFSTVPVNAVNIFCQKLELADNYQVFIDDDKLRYSFQITKGFSESGLISSEVFYMRRAIKIKKLDSPVFTRGFPKLTNFVEIFTVICDESQLLRNPTIQIDSQVRFNLPGYLVVDGYTILSPYMCEGVIVNNNIEGTCKISGTSPPFDFPKGFEQPEPVEFGGSFPFKAIPAKLPN